MSAMPDNVLPFEVPNKPRIKLGETLPDQRKIAIVPYRVVKDKQVTHGMIKTLMLICSYANRAGITWVGQKRLAEDAGISQQAISRQVVKLTKLGYLEVIRKGKPGEWMTTWRVIYDPEITAADAMANTSNREDNRPPGIIKDEEERLHEQVNQEGLDRIQKMIAESITKAKTVTKKEYQMPKDKETITVKKMKAEIAKNKINVQPLEVVQHVQHMPVDNSQTIQHLEVVDPTTPEGCIEHGFNNKEYIFNLVINNKELKQFSKADVELQFESLHAACLSEGIEPTEQALVDGIVYMMQIKAKANAI